MIREGVPDQLRKVIWSQPRSGRFPRFESRGGRRSQTRHRPGRSGGAHRPGTTSRRAMPRRGKPFSYFSFLLTAHLCFLSYTLDTITSAYRSRNGVDVVGTTASVLPRARAALQHRHQLRIVAFVFRNSHPVELPLPLPLALLVIDPLFTPVPGEIPLHRFCPPLYSSAATRGSLRARGSMETALRRHCARPAGD